MKTNLLNSFQSLRKYCEAEKFKGWDPYDGLNSKVFQALPFFKKSAICRLIMIQGFKRSPFNLRRLMLVPKGYNAKGIGLFLQGYCNLYKAVTENPLLENSLGTAEELKQQINELAELLISLQSKGYSGACWGYNFDWQARRLFLFPKFTPTVVATNFCATALIDAYEITENKRYLDIALSAAKFVMNDLHRADYNGGFLFSYSPLKGNDTVFNASLLGSKLLSYCYRYTGNEAYRDAARQSVVACCNGQSDDGSWVYGMLPVQSWIDSFHTGYNLDGLIAYEEQTGDTSEDLHRPVQADAACLSPSIFWGRAALPAGREDSRPIHGNKKGYFYYQLKPGISSRISYMRWSNAFMFNALSYYILSQCKTIE